VNKGHKILDNASKQTKIFSLVGLVILILLVLLRLSGSNSDDMNKNIIGMIIFVVVFTFIHFMFKWVYKGLKKD
jgi:hypothetical protein